MNLLKALVCAAAMAAFALPATAAAQTAEAPGSAAAAKTKAKAKTGTRTTTKTRSRSKARARAAAKAKQPRVKTYDFTGDKLEGDLVGPDGIDVRGRIAATHTSLIKVRQDFVREIGKAAEDL